MDRKIASDLANTILLSTKIEGKYKLEDYIAPGYIESFHTFANNKESLGAFLISDGSKSYWIFIIDWQSKNNFYLVVYPEKSNQAPLAEIHKQTVFTDGVDLVWRYSPRKKDGLNEQRKEQFSNMIGGGEFVLSLPSNLVTFEDTLDDLFRLIACRVLADQLGGIDSNQSSDSFPEGRRVERKHYLRERSSALVEKAKKEYALKNDGRLPCEVCGFDFRECYGSHGDSYIEAHHIIPLSELCSADGAKTRLEDLAMVCSNCHRMLHRAPRIDLYTLREQFK
ncbi:HNH endonuclease [Vibrio harveyi]